MPTSVYQCLYALVLFKELVRSTNVTSCYIIQLPLTPYILQKSDNSQVCKPSLFTIKLISEIKRVTVGLLR